MSTKAHSSSKRPGTGSSGKEGKKHQPKSKAAESMNAAAQRAMEDEKRVLKEKMDKAGLSFEDHGLPDEDLNLDDPLIRKSFWKSLKGLFPWTDEYYEGMAAEEEMDDLRAIRIEKAKAADLLALTKTGKHEEALASMMSETNNDFFFFNKLMTKYREEGKWEFEAPELNMFGLMEAAQRRNRIRRAFRATYQLTTGDQDTALQGTLNAMDNSKRINTSTTCNWKGKNKQGEKLKCCNERFPHPRLKDLDPITKKEIPKLLDQCAYHMENCIEEHGGATAVVAIKVPNALGMCTECHMTKHPEKPIQQMLKKETCPGVRPADAKAELPSEEALAAKVEEDNQLTEDSICEWLASKKEIKLRGWQCGNKVIRNPTNKTLQHVCGWHVKICLQAHTGGAVGTVEVPNQHGLCIMHYTAQFGEPPSQPDFPYPGMKVKKAKNAWMSEGHHWASPRWAPSFARVCEEYEPPDLPEDFMQRVIAAGKYAKYANRKRKEGKRMCTKLQATWRRFKVHGMHRKLIYEKIRQKRLEAVILMQCVGRRRMAYNRVSAIRKRRNGAALFVQRHFRGFISRKKTRQLWAGRRILAFFKRLRFLKFRDAVIVMMQLRRLSKRRHSAARNIQRVIRGHRCRLQLFQEKLWEWVKNRSAKVITAEIRAYIAKKPKVIDKFQYPTEAWARRECGKRIAKMLWRILLNRRARAAFRTKLGEVAKYVQRHARGFIARKGVAKMAFLHKEMQKWIKPELAAEFTQRFYDSNVFYLADRVKKAPPPPPPPVEKTWLLRPFLNETVKEDPEVSEEDFHHAIHKWYNSQHVPIISSEIKALRDEFQNPATGKVVIASLEDYIMLSKLPCRKHGRTICGKCFFRGKCSTKGCTCPEYYPSKEGHNTSVCKDCFHAPDFHRRNPMQIKEGDKPRSMLQLMRAVREPDTSMPMTVQGMDYSDTIVPPEDPDDIQLRRYNAAETKAKEMTSTLSAYRASTLSLMLMFLEEKGENIAKIDEYWGQQEVKIVGDLTTDLSGKKLSKSDKANVNVPIYPVPPDISVSQEVFWANMAKNPNKSKRDYDEKMDHNMPMPVMQANDIVYTFEGSKVYLNLLIQIIDIGEGKVQGAKLHFDNPDFLRLITNHIQIFERHWRKMVADIRSGTLNRNAQVSKEDRTMFEALGLPRVKLAATLDNAFRDLGFHTNGMGKDLKAGPYAQRIRFPTRQPKDRRPSLPMTASGIGRDLRDIELRGTVRLKGPISGTGEFESPMKERHRLKAEAEAAMRARGMSPIRASSRSGSRGGGSRGSSRGRSRSPDAASSSRPGTGSTLPHPPIKNMSRRELLVLVGDSMKVAPAEVEADFRESRSRGPSRRTAGDRRRGSETDIARDISSGELHALDISQQKSPRTGYHFTIQTDGDRFICPFPACGKVFKSKDAAFKHLPSHEQKVRLYAPTALPDSHLNFYWPKDSPWQRHEQFTEIVQPVGNCICTIAGCGRSFANKEKLENHIRLQHNILPSNSVANSYYDLQGQPLCVPPFPPPASCAFAVQYCTIHLNPSGGCMKCIALEKGSGPKPPFRFYEGAGIDLRAKAEAAKVKYAGDDFEASAAGKKGKKSQRSKSRSPSPTRKPDTPNDGLNRFRVRPYDMDQVILYRRTVGIIPSTHMGYCCSIMTDKGDNIFVGMRPFLSYSELVAHEVEVPRDFDKENELMILPEEEEGDFSWVPIATVIGHAPVMYVESKNQWKKAVKNKKIPRNSYYIRE